MKKHLYFVLFACLTGLIMTACGSDGDDDFIPRKDSGSLKSGMLEVNKRIYLNDEMNGLDENKAAEFDSFMKELYRKL